MPSRTGGWMIIIGAVIMVAGLCTLPAAFGDKGDESILGIGASIFGLGAITIAAGIYLKASALQSKGGEKTAHENTTPSRSTRGGCDRCQAEAPVIHCKVHQQHLCGTCLAEHYDFRSCVYAPSPRRGAGAKSMAARAR